MQAPLMADVIPAGPFVTNGEIRTAEVLRKLPEDWVVICNKMLHPKDGRDYELDFIIIADNTVFLLEEKSWKGRFTGTDQMWVKEDGWSVRSPLAKIGYTAKVLAGHLRDTIPELKKCYFIDSGVVLSAAKELPLIINDGKAKDHIFLLPDVDQRLKELDQGRDLPIIKQRREKIKNCLYNLSPRPETPAHINNIYMIEDSTVVRPGARLLHSKLIGWNEPRDLMVYDLSTDALPRDKLRLFYMREFKALKDLNPTGYVPEVKDPFDWSDDFLVLPIVPPEGKSLAAYPLPTTSAELINELYLAAEAFKVLAIIHQHNVLHRAINPVAIYIRQNSSPFGLVFTNFFAARTGPQSIFVSLDAQKIEDPYIAPELMKSYRDAKQHTDVFSLALVFLERWSGQPLEVLRPEVSKSVVLPNFQACWPLLPTKGMVCLNELFRSIFLPSSKTPRLRPSIVAEHLEEIAHILEQ